MIKKAIVEGVGSLITVHVVVFMGRFLNPYLANYFNGLWVGAVLAFVLLYVFGWKEKLGCKWWGTLLLRLGIAVVSVALVNLFVTVILYTYGFAG